MTQPMIHGNVTKFSASSVLTAVADELSLIRQQDGLTWADIGVELGRSGDQAAKYADGSAEMGIIAFARARRRWNGRFTGALDRLIEGERHNDEHDRVRHSKILKAALALSVALEDDDQIDAKEVHANRATIESARDALDALLGKLAVRSAS